MIHLSSKDAFDKYIATNKGLILLDFWASWCGPCLALGKTLEEIDKHNKHFEVAKVDIEENIDLAAMHKIKNIPFMAVYKNGELVDSRVGAISFQEILEWMESFK